MQEEEGLILVLRMDAKRIEYCQEHDHNTLYDDMEPVATRLSTLPLLINGTYSVVSYYE